METIGIIISLIFLVVFLVMANNIAILRNKVVRDAPDPLDDFRIAWIFGREEEAKRLLESALYFEWKENVDKHKSSSKRSKEISKIRTKYSAEMESLKVEWPQHLR